MDPKGRTPYFLQNGFAKLKMVSTFDVILHSPPDDDEDIGGFWDIGYSYATGRRFLVNVEREASGRNVVILSCYECESSRVRRGGFFEVPKDFKALDVHPFGTEVVYIMAEEGAFTLCMAKINQKLDDGKKSTPSLVFIIPEDDRTHTTCYCHISHNITTSHTTIHMRSHKYNKDPSNMHTTGACTNTHP